MTNQEFSNNVINSMIPYLNPNQINLLSASLTKELYEYKLVKDCNEIVACYDSINETFLRKFEIEKHVQGMSNKTIYQYISATRKFLNTIQKDFQHVTKDDVTYYLALIIKSGSMNNTSLDNTRRFISPFFSWCCDNDYISKNPFNGIKRIKQDKKIKEILSDKDIVLLRDTCKDNKRDLALIDLLLSTGIRVSELTNLKVENVDFNTGEITIYGEKTRTWRKVYLSMDAIKHLSDYIIDREHNSEYLFNSNKKPYGKTCNQSIEKKLKSIAERANVSKHCTVHLFRRTLATRLYKKGLDMKYIASLMGHNVRTLEECYLIISDEEIKSKYMEHFLI